LDVTSSHRKHLLQVKVQQAIKSN